MDDVSFMEIYKYTYAYIPQHQPPTCPLLLQTLKPLRAGVFDAVAFIQDHVLDRDFVQKAPVVFTDILLPVSVRGKNDIHDVVIGTANRVSILCGGLITDR